MSIIWKYINKPSVSIAVIRDYDSMRNIINVTPQEVKNLYDDLASPASAKYSYLPKQHNPNANEIRLADSFDKLNILHERYKQAIDYMRWFEPAWGFLTDKEQLVLREFYMGSSLKSGATTRLQHKLSYSESNIDKLKRKALSKISLLLFGR